MKLITSKQALVECLGIVNKAVSSRSSIQVLSGVLIDARVEGSRAVGHRHGDIHQGPSGSAGRRARFARRAGSIASDIARSLPVGGRGHRTDEPARHRSRSERANHSSTCTRCLPSIFLNYPLP